MNYYDRIADQLNELWDEVETFNSALSKPLLKAIDRAVTEANAASRALREEAEKERMGPQADKA